MRGVQFELGLITEEEFYGQEWAEEMDREGERGRERRLERQLEIEQRKERLCNEMMDNFDVHYERRKKELHDNLLKKMQQHEKSTQQMAPNQATVAYAKCSHALL